MTDHVKNLSDTMTISDSLVKSVGKPLADSVSIREPFCVPITIDHTKVAGDLTDFVFPINERDLPASFWLAVQADGLNIAVYQGATKLKRQVAYINKTTEVLEVYVRVPSLSSSVDTVLTLCAGTTEYADDADTWPATWVFVSDMSDYNGGTQIRDWSQYGNHGTKGAGAAAPTEVAGVVGMAQQFVSASQQYISAADAPEWDCANITLELLLYQDAYTGGRLLNRESLWRVYQNASGQIRFRTGGLSDDITVNAPLSQWQHYAVTFDGTDLFASLNGSTSTKTVTGTLGSSAESLYIGARRVASDWTDSHICEARYSSVARTADEIATDDASLRGTATFYAVGTGQVGIAKDVGKALADSIAIVDSMVMTGDYDRPGIKVAAFLYNRAINTKSRREF